MILNAFLRMKTPALCIVLSLLFSYMVHAEEDYMINYQRLGRIEQRSKISISPSGVQILLANLPNHECALMTPDATWGGLVTEKLPHKNCSWETSRDILRFSIEPKGVYMAVEPHMGSGSVIRNNNKIYFTDEHGKRLIGAYAHGAKKLFVTYYGKKTEITTPEFQRVYNFSYDEIGRRVDLNVNGVTHLIYDLNTKERFIFPGYYSDGNVRIRKEYFLVPGEKYIFEGAFYDTDDVHPERNVDNPPSPQLRLLTLAGETVQTFSDYSGARSIQAISPYLLVYNYVVYKKVKVPRSDN